MAQMLRYLGRHRWTMAVIAALVAVSAGANITGTYLLKPVINTYIIPGDLPGLARMVIFMAGLYLTGAASCYGYNQLMVRVTQKVVSEIRFDLFTHAQRLPLNYFDTHTHRGTHEPFHQRRGHHHRGAKRQLYHADPELHHHHRNPDHAGGVRLGGCP